MADAEVRPHRLVARMHALPLNCEHRQKRGGAGLIGWKTLANAGTFTAGGAR